LKMTYNMQPLLLWFMKCASARIAVRIVVQSLGVDPSRGKFIKGMTAFLRITLQKIRSITRTSSADG
ncbi:hypothetical protein BAE44_0016784, partial [Dichanthelium oligosanthes]